MGNFKEWLSDNLRYILLIIFLGVVLTGGFFGVRAIRHIGGADNRKETEAKTTEKASEAESDVIVSQKTNALVQNDIKVLTTMTSYYTAKTNKDIETLVKIEPTIDQAKEIEELENTNVESYSNIKTYSQAGPEDGSFVVYVCYDGKVRGIDTFVPSLVQYYLKTDTEDNFYIADVDKDDAAKSFLQEAKNSNDVQALLDQVNSAYEAALASDPVLKEFMNKKTAAATVPEDDEDEPAEDENKEKVPSKREWMIANDSCNVRKEANVDSEALGYLSYGEDIEAIGKEGDWYKIDFNGTEAYVHSDFLSTQDEFLHGQTEELQGEEYYEEEYYDYYGQDDGSGEYYD